MVFSWALYTTVLHTNPGKSLIEKFLSIILNALIRKLVGGLSSKIWKTRDPVSSLTLGAIQKISVKIGGGRGPAI